MTHGTCFVLNITSDFKPPKMINKYLLELFNVKKNHLVAPSQNPRNNNEYVVNSDIF